MVITDIENPKISEAAAAHATVNDEPRIGAIRVCEGDGGVRLSWWRAISIATGNVPLKHIAVRLQLQRVQIVQVTRDVVLRVFAVVGQSSKEVGFVSNQGETVTQPWAGWQSRFWILGLQPFPFPSASLNEQRANG